MPKVGKITGILAGIFVSLSVPAHAWRLEAGAASTLDTFSSANFVTVNFQQAFDTIPVVVVLPTDQGGDPSELRIQNVTTTGFDIAPVEPPGNDGPHVAMDFHYIAMEPGIGYLPDGTKVVAGIHNTNTIQASNVVAGIKSWDTVGFETTLSASATVIASIQTLNSEENLIPGTFSQPFLSVAIRNLTVSDMQIALERSEVAAGSVIAEDIGWIAFPSSTTGSFELSGGGSIDWNAFTTPDTVVGWGNSCTTYTFSAVAWANARVVGTKNRRDGADGGWTRRCSLSGTDIGLQIDEDMANDSERNHTNEAVGLLAISNSFHQEFIGEIDGQKSVEILSGNYALPSETARYTISSNSTGTTVIDPDSIALVDAIPSDVAFKVTDISGPGSGPVLFTNGTPSSNLTYTYTSLSSTSDDLEFSNDGGLNWTYIPVDIGDGTDPNITHIRILPKGLFAPTTTAGTPNFSISFDAIII